MYVYIDRKKKFPVTTLLRALGYSSRRRDPEAVQPRRGGRRPEGDPEGLHRAASSAATCSTRRPARSSSARTRSSPKTCSSGSRRPTCGRSASSSPRGRARVRSSPTPSQKDTSRSDEEALNAIYQQLRSGEAPDLETAKNLLERLFFNEKRYDLGDVGRYRMNCEAGPDRPRYRRRPSPRKTSSRSSTTSSTCRQGSKTVDDIDHLGNRRVRTVGEQIGQQFNIGLARMARTIRERLGLRDQEKVTPQDLVNARTITSVINAFFGTNQLSQFMDQTNPLAEITHKRRMSALGPGGLTRERAGFEVRDVHYTHYGRLCPIETPEGPNIGLISSLCIHARVNEFGFIETPYRKVKNGKVSDDIEYLTAEKEDVYTIAQANAVLDEKGRFTDEKIKAQADSRDYRDGQAGGDPVHGRGAEPDRLGGRGPHPVPRARRRQPRPDGIEHAAPGGSPAPARGPDRRHGHGGEDRARRPHHDGRRAQRRRWSTSTPTRSSSTTTSTTMSHEALASFEDKKRVEYQLVEVLPDEPGHLHQPARDRQAGDRVQEGRRPGRRLRHEQRRAGPRPERARGVHAVERVQLRGRHHRQRDASSPRTSSPRSTSRSSTSRSATRSEARRS